MAVTTGYGGTCLGGSCKSGSAWDTFTVRHLLAFHGCRNTDAAPRQAWYTQNLQISIPVTVVAGLFVIMLIVCCFRGMCGTKKLLSQPTLMVSIAMSGRTKRNRSRRLSAEPALAHIRAERISSWPTQNNTPGGIPQGYNSPPRRTRETGPGMAGIGAGRPPPYRGDGLVFNDLPVSHPPSSQPRRQRHRSRSSGGHQQGWVDDGMYNGPGYQPRY